MPKVDFTRDAARDPVVRALWWIDRPYFRFWHRLRLLNPCPTPPSGPAILVCNHISSLDPVALQAVCNRIVTWMVAEEYYSKPGLYWMFRRLGAIPVDREGRDSAAFRMALKALDHGKLLGIFPEGRIESTDALLPFEPGIAAIAAKSRCPLIPAYIDGTTRGYEMLGSYLLPHRVVVNFGPPLHIGDAAGRSKAGRQQAAGEILAAMESLRAQTLGRFRDRPKANNP